MAYKLKPPETIKPKYTNLVNQRVGVMVWALILYVVVRYRKRNDEAPRQVRYNLPLEVLYIMIQSKVAVVFITLSRGITANKVALG